MKILKNKVAFDNKMQQNSAECQNLSGHLDFANDKEDLDKALDPIDAVRSRSFVKAAANEETFCEE